MSKAKAKFFGTEEQLKYFVASTGIKGTWHEAGNNSIKFHAKYGGSITWWRSTKTIKLVGKWFAPEERKIRSVINFDKKYSFNKPHESTQNSTNIKYDINRMFNSL